MGPSQMVDELVIKDSYQSYADEQMDKCPHCSRTFLQGRLIKHLKSCKGGRSTRTNGVVNKDENENENVNTINMNGNLENKRNGYSFSASVRVT